MDWLPWEHAEAADITAYRAEYYRDAHFESVVSQGIDYPGSMLKQLISPQAEPIASEMLASRTLSLNGPATLEVCWSN
jgi:hypothetical protein